jgi:hypothetical protein
VSETKSQQPSGDATVLNGWPGSEMKETGDAGASLQRDGALIEARVCPRAAGAKSIVSAQAPTSAANMFVFRMRRIIFACAPRRNGKVSCARASRSIARSKNVKLNQILFTLGFSVATS